jgi:hypothetical protein
MSWELPVSDPRNVSTTCNVGLEAVNSGVNVYRRIMGFPAAVVRAAPIHAVRMSIRIIPRIYSYSNGLDEQ